MNTTQSTSSTPRKPAKWEMIAAGWIVLALASLYPVTLFLKGTFPIFTMILLVVPLVVLARRWDAQRIGIRPISPGDLVKFGGISLGGSLLLMAIFEPWSHTYRILLTLATSSPNPDTTFGWLLRFPGPAGWIGFTLFAGLVTLFAEELFFRGWLLQWLQLRMRLNLAIVLQALLFTLLQGLAAFLLPPLQGTLYGVVYSFLAIGLIGGWAAAKTRSIWPSLASATVYNVIMVALTIP